MITIRSKTWLDARGVRKAVRQASIVPLDRCAMLVERAAKMSMRAGGGAARTPSPPGTPPNVQTGNLRSSITWGRTPHTRVVGPTRQAWYGRIHEQPGSSARSREFGGRNYPKRAFMLPALLRTRRMFASLFRMLPLGATPEGQKMNRRKGPR